MLGVEDFSIKIEQDQLDFQYAKFLLNKFFDSVKCCSADWQDKADICITEWGEHKYFCKYHEYSWYEYGKVGFLEYMKIEYEFKLKELERLVIFSKVISKHYKKSIKLIYGEATISSKKNALKNDTLFLNACLQKIDSWLRQDIKGKILNEPLSILDSEYNKCLGCIQKIYHTICEAFFFPSVMKLINTLNSSFTEDQEEKDNQLDNCTSIYGKNFRLFTLPFCNYDKLFYYSKDVENFWRFSRPLEEVRFYQNFNDFVNKTNFILYFII